MNLRHLIFTLLFVIKSIAYAQTKPKSKNKPKPTLEETANWLVEKLNAYNSGINVFTSTNDYDLMENYKYSACPSFSEIWRNRIDCYKWSLLVKQSNYD